MGKLYICKGKESGCKHYKEKTMDGCDLHRIPHKFIRLGINKCVNNTIEPMCRCRPLNFEEIMKEAIKKHKEGKE